MERCRAAVISELQSRCSGDVDRGAVGAVEGMRDAESRQMNGQPPTFRATAARIGVFVNSRWLLRSDRQLRMNY